MPEEIAASVSRPYAPACDRNRDPILAVLKEILPSAGRILEIGSGSGQHAAYFSSSLPQLEWLPSDLPESLPGINAWRLEASANCLPPVSVDLLSPMLKLPKAVGIVCINTLHIVAWQGSVNLFKAAAEALDSGSMLYLYGPYRYPDRTLEPSNIQFDAWLKARDAQSGIRDFVAVQALALENGFVLVLDQAMPANNRSLVFKRL